MVQGQPQINERFTVFYVGFPQAAVIGIVDDFELLILEILNKINLNQTVGIQKNDLNCRRLKYESLISQTYKSTVDFHT
jgi:hypothetical protein